MQDTTQWGKTLESLQQAEIQITEQDLQNIENGVTITDLDLRVCELEGK